MSCRARPCYPFVFGLGLLLLATSRVTRWLLVILFPWSLVGGSAAVVLAVPQDWVLLVSGVIVVPLLVLRDRHLKVAAA